MSDIMMQGVLRLPPEIWDNDSPIDIIQRHDRYVMAADLLLLYSKIEANQWNLRFAEPQPGCEKCWEVVKDGKVIGSGYTLEVALKNSSPPNDKLTQGRQ